MNLRKARSVTAALQHVMSAAEHPWAKWAGGAIQLFPPQSIEWNQLRLNFPAWPAAFAGFRILHLSDFHLRRRWPAAMDLLLAKIQASPPDMVLLTGDFVDNKKNYRPAMPQVRRLVEGLRAGVGCFAIHGNHDSYRVGNELRGMGVTFLDGRRITAKAPAGEMELIGLPGRHRLDLTPNFLDTIPTRAAGVPRIVLSHFPDHLLRTGGLDADLFLCGHTHGGQICLPDGRPLIWHDGLPRRFAKGAHRIDQTWLLVSRGIGYTGLPLRMYARPEVVEIICRPGEPHAVGQ